MSFSAFKYAKLSDEELVIHLGRGRAAACDELYRRYHARFLHYFLRMLNNDQDKAQDFLQELFLKIIQTAEKFNTSGRFSTWAYTVAHNMCCNEYRRLEVRQKTLSDITAEPLNNTGSHPLEKRLDNQVFKQALFNELSTLDQNKRSTFLLRYQEGFSLKEVSAILDCSVGTVKSRLFYITRHLAARLQAFDPCQEGDA